MLQEIISTIASIIRPLILIVGISVGLGLASGDDRTVRYSRIEAVTDRLFSCAGPAGIVCNLIPFVR
jgi:hypothetical protein